MHHATFRSQPGIAQQQQRSPGAEHASSVFRSNLVAHLESSSLAGLAYDVGVLSLAFFGQAVPILLITLDLRSSSSENSNSVSSSGTFNPFWILVLVTGLANFAQGVVFSLQTDNKLLAFLGLSTSLSSLGISGLVVSSVAMACIGPFLPTIYYLMIVIGIVSDRTPSIPDWHEGLQLAPNDEAEMNDAKREEAIAAATEEATSSYFPAATATAAVVQKSTSSTRRRLTRSQLLFQEVASRQRAFLAQLDEAAAARVTRFTFFFIQLGLGVAQCGILFFFAPAALHMTPKFLVFFISTLLLIVSQLHAALFRPLSMQGVVGKAMFVLCDCLTAGYVFCSVLPTHGSHHQQQHLQLNVTSAADVASTTAITTTVHWLLGGFEVRDSLAYWWLTVKLSIVLFVLVAVTLGGAVHFLQNTQRLPVKLLFVAGGLLLFTMVIVPAVLLLEISKFTWLIFIATERQGSTLQLPASVYLHHFLFSAGSSGSTKKKNNNATQKRRIVEWTDWQRSFATFPTQSVFLSGADFQDLVAARGNKIKNRGIILKRIARRAAQRMRLPFASAADGDGDHIESMAQETQPRKVADNFLTRARHVFLSAAFVSDVANSITTAVARSGINQMPALWSLDARSALTPAASSHTARPPRFSTIHQTAVYDAAKKLEQAERIAQSGITLRLDSAKEHQSIRMRRPTQDPTSFVSRLARGGEKLTVSRVLFGEMTSADRQGILLAVIAACVLAFSQAFSVVYPVLNYSLGFEQTRLQQYLLWPCIVTMLASVVLLPQFLTMFFTLSIMREIGFISQTQAVDVSFVVDSYFSQPISALLNTTPSESVPSDAFSQHVLPFLEPAHVGLYGAVDSDSATDDDDSHSGQGEGTETKTSR